MNMTTPELEKFEKWWDEKGFIAGSDTERCFQAWQARQPEIDALKTELSGAQSVNEVANRKIDALKAEVERLRKDAERYQIVRHCDARVLRQISEIDGFDKFDARVDELSINGATDWDTYRSCYIDAAMANKGE